jgi:radical SAM-linked protein
VKAQRLRFTYRVGEAGCSLGQRDLIRAFEKATTEAGLALSYSEGKRKTAQIAVAAPLPQNVTSDGELVEVFLSEPVDPRAALKAISERLPQGIEAVDVEEVGVQAPSLQSQLRLADYEVELPPDVDEAMHAMRSNACSPRLRSIRVPARNTGRQYDLRPLVLSLALKESMTDMLYLACVCGLSENNARADQVVWRWGGRGNTYPSPVCI